MKTKLLATLTGFMLLAGSLFAQVPQLLNYQGRVAVGIPAVNFEGNGLFRFALVNADASTSYWSNDGTSTAGSQPAAAVSLIVTKGLYAVLLGDTALPNMTAIPNSVFNHADVRLRVWFDDGSHGPQLLTPDQRLAAVGYAMMADSVKDGAITSAKLAAGAVGSTQLADFSVSGDKLRLGTETGTAVDGTINYASNTFTFTRTFDYPFSAAPAVSLLSPGWSLGPVSATGFSATIPTYLAFVPQTLDSTGNVGEHTSLAVVDGHPAISYFDSTNGDLKYVRASNPAGTTWNPPVTVDTGGPGTVTVGEYTSLAVVDGCPAISYSSSSIGHLLFVRATDPGGTTWGTPVTLDFGANVGLYSSLAVVNGNPAVCYWDASNANLKFVRATNASGTSWAMPQTIESAGIVGQFASLAVVNGLPAISYYDIGNGNLKYVRATLPDGSYWAPPVTVDSGGTVGQYTSLAVVNGHPAISYYDLTNADLKYVRASDVMGDTWGVPPKRPDINGPGPVGQYTSLAVVDGNPVIGYLAQTGGLKYVRASDASGTAWGVPMVLDSTCTNGSTFTSLAVVNGQPAIGYHHPLNSDLKFIAISDPELRWQASDGSVAPLIAANAASVAAGAVGSAQLAANAVQSSNIAAGAVGTTQLAANAVQSGNIAEGAVSGTQLASNLTISGTLTAGRFQGNGVLPWQTVAGTAQVAAPNTGYVLTNAAQANVMLPATANIGDVVRVSGAGAGGWLVAPNSGQTILIFPAGLTWTAHESNRAWQALASSADGTKLVAVDGGGRIYTSTDSGGTWTAREIIGPWSSVASSADGTKLVAVQNGGQIFASTDSGGTWTARTSAFPPTPWSSVASSADGTKLVAVQNGGQIFTSTDSGATWTARASDINRPWSSVASSADGTKLVAAEIEGQIHTSTDSGVTWTVRGPNGLWTSVASSADGTKLVAVGYESMILTSTDAGVTWRTPGYFGYWGAVASSADGTKLVAAEVGGQIHTSADSGVTWTARADGRDWWAVACSADGSKLVAVENGGRIYTWTALLTGTRGTTAALQYIGNNQWQSLEESQIAAGAVGTTQLAANAVQSGNIATGAVGSAQIATGAIGSSQMAGNAVTTGHLAAGAVGTAQIADAAVTAAKIGGVLGSGQIPELDAAKITTGTLADARLSTNVALLDRSVRFAGDVNAYDVTANGSLQALQLVVGSWCGADNWSNNVLGGQSNVIRSFNNAGTYNNVIAGGKDNEIYGNSDARADYCFIGEGSDNHIWNSRNSVILYGYNNYIVGADYSFAAGTNSRADHNGCFVWSDSTFSGLSTWQDNQFMVKACGGVRFFTNETSTTGVYLNPSGSEWHTVSNSNAKKNFLAADTREILAKLMTVPITWWNYKAEADDAVPHLGPMAQDFIGTFYPKAGDEGIGTLQFDGVALAAIQGLNEELKAEAGQRASENQALRAELADKDARLASLEQRLAEMEKHLKQAK